MSPSRGPRNPMLAGLLALGLLMTPFVGEGGNERGGRILDYFARESVVCDSLTTGVALSASVYTPAAHPPRAEYARITVEGADARWIATGTVAALVTEGQIAAAGGDPIELHGYNSIANFRCVASTVPNAHLRVQYAR